MTSLESRCIDHIPRLAQPGLLGIEMGLPAMECLAGQPSPKPSQTKRELETSRRALTSLPHSIGVQIAFTMVDPAQVQETCSFMDIPVSPID